MSFVAATMLMYMEEAPQPWPCGRWYCLMNWNPANHHLKNKWGKNYQPQLVQDFWTINSRTFFLGGILHGREHFARKVNLSQVTPKRALSSWCFWWWDILRYLCADKRALMEHHQVSPLFLAEELVAQSACFSFLRRWKNASPMHSSRGIFTPVNKKILPWFFEPRDRWWLRWWKKPNLPLLCWLCWRFDSKRSPPSGRCVAYWKTFCQRPSWKGKHQRL